MYIAVNTEQCLQDPPEKCGGGSARLAHLGGGRTNTGSVSVKQDMGPTQGCNSSKAPWEHVRSQSDCQDVVSSFTQ